MSKQNTSSMLLVVMIIFVAIGFTLYAQQSKRMDQLEVLLLRSHGGGTVEMSHDMESKTSQKKFDEVKKEDVAGEESNDAQDVDISEDVVVVQDGQWQEWKETLSVGKEYKFLYPTVLSNKSVGLYEGSEWPPLVYVVDTSQDEIIDPIYKPDFMVDLNGNTYGVSDQWDGTAGPDYRMLQYVTQRGDLLITVNFILEYSSCDAYDAADRSKCAIEQENLDIDSMVDHLVGTLQAV